MCLCVLVCVCMGVCVCVWMCLYGCVCLHGCVCVGVWVWLWAYACVRTGVRCDEYGHLTLCMGRSPWTHHFRRHMCT